MADRPFPVVEGVEHRYVEAAGLRFHVAEAGEGEPLVLVHGWPQHWYAWRHLIPRLAEHHRVICPDLRGFGWSDAPADGYEKERLADDVLAVLDALELERVKLMGHDWGGFAGFLMCLKAPERIESYVACSINHPFPPEKRDPRALLRLWYQALIASPMLGQRVVSGTDFIERVLSRGAAGATRTPAELTEFTAPFREPARARATVQLYRTFLMRELKPLIGGRYANSRLTVPTLLLVGADDPVIRPEGLAGGERYADRLRIETIPGEHWLLEETPDEVADRALAHFSS